MKKHLSFMNNENGFVLPYVLFVSTILFIIVLTNVHMYKKEIDLTYLHLDQLKIETLFQKGYEKIKQEIPLDELENQENRTFVFPEGYVSVEFHKIEDQKVQLRFHIYTNDDSMFIFDKRIHLSSDQF